MCVGVSVSACEWVLVCLSVSVRVLVCARVCGCVLV